MMQHTYHKKFTDSEIATIVSALRGLPTPPRQSGVNVLADNAALKVLDCVLSLNRRYDEFVVPTLQDFKKRNPTVISLSDLDNLKNSLGGAYDFFCRELGYYDYDRAQVFDLVLTYLIKAIPQFTGCNELESLRLWATGTKPTGYEQMLYVEGVGPCRPKGFAIAGWQYLRMWFGADTCKPDRHIVQFLKDTLRRNVNPANAVELMEITAPLAGLAVREADHRIWSNYSKKSKTRAAKHCGPGRRTSQAGPARPTT